jgi:hypothetical protein
MSDASADARRFAALQERLRKMFDVEPIAGRTRVIVVIPSFTVDRDLLARSPSLQYWEHRMLYLLTELKNPAVRVIYVTSREISRAALDYYVDLMPDLSPEHLARLRLITCPTSAGEALAERLLRRPDILDDLRRAIEVSNDAYIECFASTTAERDLSYTLNVPMYGSDPSLTRYGLKSMSRRLFRSLGVPISEGVEGVRGFDELVHALVEVKDKNPEVQKAVVKLDDSLGGVGNAVFSYSGAPGQPARREWVKRELEGRLELAMSIIDRTRFLDRVASSGCVVECFVEGVKTSPSVQCEIRPNGEVLILSTHEQRMAGTLGQHFSGCFLPARHPRSIHDAARLIGAALQRKGVIGCYGVDFVAVENGPERHLYALEINLRNLGTTHHLMSLKGLTGGTYLPQAGAFFTADGEARFYYGSDSIVLPDAIGLPASELLAQVMQCEWTYRASKETGVVLHMVDAVDPYGRVGLTCIGRSAVESYGFYSEALGELQEVR